MTEPQTAPLHHATQALLADKTALAALAHALHEQLRHFRALDVVTAQFAAGLAVTDPAFLTCLGQLDASLRFVRSHPNYVDAPRYTLRLATQLTRALALLKDHIVREWRALVVPAARDGAPPQSEASRAYVEWRALAPTLRPYCVELERRGPSESASLLVECQSHYYALRRELMTPLMRDNLQRLSRLPLAQAAAEGVSYLASTSALEYQLLRAHFDRDPPELGPQLLGPLAALWLDWLRPLVIGCRALPPLCLAVAALRAALAELRHQQRRGGALTLLEAYVEQAVATVREKVVFVAQAVCRADVEGFRPSPADLAYPACLLGEGAAPNVSVTDALDAAAPVTNWYPPVERCVLALRRLHTALEEGSVLDGLAHELVAAAVAALLRASAHIGHAVSLVDGQLFLLKHLCVLRDTMRALGVAHAVTERRLDLAQMRHALRNLVDVRVLSLSRDNPLLAVVPDVTAHAVDVRKDVELLVAHTTDVFVSTALEPVVAPLRMGLFAAPKCAAALRDTADALAVRLPETLAVVKLYLTEPGPLFSAVQDALLAPLEPLRQGAEALAPGPERDALLALLEERRHLVGKTVSQML